MFKIHSKRASSDVNITPSKKRKVYVKVPHLVHLSKYTPTTSMTPSTAATPPGSSVDASLWEVRGRNRSLSVDSTLESDSAGSSDSPDGSGYHSTSGLLSPWRFDGVEIPPPLSRPIVSIYRPPLDEVSETRKVRIPGESSEPSSNPRGVPVRLLSDFSFYDLQNQLIPFDQVETRVLSKSSLSVLASGLVTCCSIDGQPPPSTGTDTFVRLTLSEIVGFWTDYTTRDLVGLWQIRVIAVKTEFAWYILQTPADTYASSFQPFWLAHFITWRAVHAMRQKSDITRRQFFTYLKKANDPDFLDIMGREISECDLSQPFVASYLLAQLDVKSAVLESMKQLPLVQEFAQLEISPEKTEANNTLTVVTSDCTPKSPPVIQHPPISHPDNPFKVDCGDLIPNHPAGDRAYSSFFIDGVPYKSGDYIMVKPGIDELAHRALNATQRHSMSHHNEMGDQVWFCKICYMIYSNDESNPGSEPLLHVEWLEHSSKTILQELAHPLELFGLLECDDIPVNAVLGLINVSHLDSNNNSDGYFCCFFWDSDGSTFERYSPSIQSTSTVYCQSCDYAFQQECLKSSHPIECSPQKITLKNGIEYHVNDFIYISEDASRLYTIGQLSRIFQTERSGKWKVQVSLFGRFDDIARLENDLDQPRDERRLFQTAETVDVSLSELQGKCWVVNYDEIDSEHGFEAFYVDRWAPILKVSKLSDLENLKEKIQRCSICLAKTRQARDELRTYKRDQVPLRTMELFAGAGGLSTGLEQTGFIKSYWAVELSPGAAATYQANHEDSIVYNEDTNICLQSALDEAAGKHGRHLKTVKDGKRLMPRPGEVDLIAGGFPCQSFSGMNHQRQRSDDDIRTTLVVNMLSYVDFYRPRFVLMENVKGLLQHHSKISRLEPNENIADTLEVVKMSIVKFILRTLLHLGYQVRFRVLEAADYGSPQRRERVIFMAAQCNEVLPLFPVPTHVTESYRGQVLALPTGDKLHPVERDPKQHAPFHALTVADAISDLPKFAWIHPGCELGSEESELTLRDSDCKSFSAVSSPRHTLVGFPAPVIYRTGPLTRYQQDLRSSEQKVTLHCSRTFQTAVVERVWHICSHKYPQPADLPQQFWTPALRSSIQNNSLKVWKTRFACRLQCDRAFNTALTTCRPFSKGTSVLHPTQKRIITARECARSQGFPDNYHFVQQDDCRDWSKLLNDIHKQIGNAVPVPLARALGRSLRTALLEKWRNTQKTQFEFKFS